MSRAPAVEMTADPRFTGRVYRLAATSLVALGLIFVLWLRTRHNSVLVGASLAAGWALMPPILIASLGRPILRYALAIPASLVGLALLATCFWNPSDVATVRIGWLQVCAGVLIGGVLGGWFWFRLLPVPDALNDPFSAGRWALIALHVTLIVAGLILVALPVSTS